MKIRYLDGVPGYDKKLGCGVVKGGIYETNDKVAGNLISTGKFELVEENKIETVKTETVKEVKKKRM